MRNSITLLVAIVMMSCGQSTINTDQWNKLNGYWEIDQVIAADGQEVDFKANTIYDYFEVNDSIGRRFKVKPQLDGSFITNHNVEDFTLRQTDSGTVFMYRTDFNSWTEVLQQLDADHFEVKNAEGISYRYKKAGPIKLTEDETQE